jgi:hypothetical protein
MGFLWIREAVIPLREKTLAIVPESGGKYCHFEMPRQYLGARSGFCQSGVHRALDDFFKRPQCLRAWESRSAGKPNCARRLPGERQHHDLAAAE